MKNPFLSVVIPAYNEAKIRGKEFSLNIKKIHEYLIKKKSFEIIIVNDGSTDNTKEFVIDLTTKYNNLKLISSIENKGKWASIREGFLHAKGDYILFTDADGATDISNLNKFWEYINNNEDIIIGSRNLENSEIIKDQPKHKKILGKLGNILIQVMLNLQGIEDTQCGFKVFSKKFANHIFPHLKINRWGGDFEILTLGKRCKYNIIEIPVTWEDSGQSLVGTYGYIQTLKELFIIKYKIITKQYKGIC